MNYENSFYFNIFVGFFLWFFFALLVGVVCCEHLSYCCFRSASFLFHIVFKRFVIKRNATKQQKYQFQGNFAGTVAVASVIYPTYGWHSSLTHTNAQTYFHTPMMAIIHLYAFCVITFYILFFFFFFLLNEKWNKITSFWFLGWCVCVCLLCGNNDHLVDFDDDCTRIQSRESTSAWFFSFFPFYFILIFFLLFGFVQF